MIVAYIRYGNTYLLESPVWRGLRQECVRLTEEVLRENSIVAIKGDADFLKFGGDQIIRSEQCQQ